jgi:mannose/fructose-specific phosphotransferase system component IIA
VTRLILVTHRGIATALVHIATLILDRPVLPGIVEVGDREDADLAEQRIEHEIRQSCAAQPPLILTDLPGATPHNLAVSVAARRCRHARVLSGLNLPMLLRALTHTELPSAELAERVCAGARESIFVGAVDGD